MINEQLVLKLDTLKRPKKVSGLVGADFLAGTINVMADS